MRTEDYVTYEQACKLKELDYKEPCSHYYTKENAADNEVWLTPAAYSPEDWNNGRNHEPDFLKPLCSAPHVHAVLRFLREKHNLHVNIEAVFGKKWTWEVVDLAPWQEPMSDEWESRVPEEPYKVVSSYDTALSAGIDAALEILKRKFDQYHKKEMNKEFKQTSETCANCLVCGNPPTPICSKLYWEGDWGSDATCILNKEEGYCEHYLNKDSKTYTEK